MTRNDALKILQSPTYSTAEDEKKDMEYFLKKMKWSEKDLSKYISDAEVSHSFYGSEKQLWNFLAKIYKKLKFIKKNIN